MSILGSIFSKILGHHGGAAPASPGINPAASPVNPANITSTRPAPAGPSPSTPPGSDAPTTAEAASGGPVAATVDVAVVLNGLAAQSREKLDWKHSIVDMMKLLGLDGSLSARQALAQELHYSGDMHDSASMNIWLHKQVMQKLAENGGKVPDDLRV